MTACLRIGGQGLPFWSWRRPGTADGSVSAAVDYRLTWDRQKLEGNRLRVAARFDEARGVLLETSLALLRGTYVSIRQVGEERD